ncbi:hypothetical protein GCM10010341_85470 [Streptomyces noursei]|nr:hypothetical protein GCM10010341_85470 [Streptomyces noursei]
MIRTAYQFGADGIQAPSGADSPLRDNHPPIGWFLTSQLVHERREYQAQSFPAWAYTSNVEPGWPVSARRCSPIAALRLSVLWQHHPIRNIE